MESNLIDLQYPIGRPVLPEGPLTAAQRAGYINQLAALPATLTAAARAAGGVRLENSYRPGGWTGRQVVHHVADVHLNFYLRFRLALTEEHPTIRPFDMNAWAALPDNDATPITVSLALLEALHSRWVTLLWHLTDAQWRRTFFHPLYQQTYTLDQALVQYAWHGQHHLAHLHLLRPVE
ncbi:putative metal-dependent hydrolase [Hymenobacter lutimineralis]|uniref:Putative metal-dependent hydrolase n=1 Tax=Hymenobacter lutimineralis TaxID=2606448 RepID=A0A5D6VFT7_9BACT|nr:putative metal-dependent hydrolase [Hymenobacter lutimineralis]TYZ14366.1 putative metal-dependent hydrolase [Hymenobacter lutimineralis]